MFVCRYSTHLLAAEDGPEREMDEDVRGMAPKLMDQQRGEDARRGQRGG